ncbi:DNA-binding transcriptional LysR family regulator [Robbsia andropogonis]|uniref:LysR family transcriptional regulator n=1 Tax=Robbsia andropogonis TaxID=28092 RepID=UPI003D208229
MMRELKTFLAVVRFGTFASAGAHIGVTQSAVSAQMQRLEEELGFPLFDRTGRSASLNAAGKRAVTVAEELLAVYARLVHPEEDNEQGGQLRVGAIASAQVSFLVPALQRFRDAAPAWRVRLIPGVSLNLLSMVDGGDADLAVLIKPPFAIPPELRWRTLRREPFVVLAPATMQASAWREALRSQPFIRYDTGSFGGRLVDRFLRRARINVQEIVELDELQAIVDLVAHGVGVALVPMAASLRLGEAVRVLSLGQETFHREIGILERNVQPRKKMLECFTQCVVDATRPIADTHTRFTNDAP